MIWLYNIFVLGGAGYVVFALGHSGWWIVWAILLLRSEASENAERDD